MSRLEKINPGTHLLLTWSAVPLIVVFFIGMIPLAGFIPPPDPQDSADQIVAMYTENLTAIRVGLILSALSFTLMFAWGASLASLTFRTENGFPGLTFTQLVCCSAGSALTFLIFLIWSVASFRPTEYDPETVLMLNDLGWFCFLWIVPPFSLWSIAMGLAIIKDKAEIPTFPRWTAYVCFLEAFLMEGVMFIALAKEGPLAYNGLIAFYIPVAAFFVWMVVMTWHAHKAILRLAREGRAADAAPSATAADVPTPAPGGPAGVGDAVA